MLDRQKMVGMHRSVVVVLSGALLGTILGRPMPAMAASASSLETKAEAAFDGGRLTESQNYYEQALQRSKDPALRRRSLGRLVEISYRSAAFGSVVQFGLELEPLLSSQDDRRQKAELSLRIAESYFALGQFRPSQKYITQSLDLERSAPLPPILRLSALTLDARIADKYSDVARSGLAWKEIERQKNLLDADSKVLTPLEKFECTRKLATAYELRRESRQAISLLEPLLLLHDQLDDPLGKRETLEQLARLYGEEGKHSKSVELLREAVAVHEAKAGLDHRRAGDLKSQLAYSLDALGRNGDAETLRAQSFEHFQAVLKNDAVSKEDAIAKIDAFWKLQSLWQRSEDYRSAVRLAQDHESVWNGHGWMEPRIKGELGGLQLLLGDYAQAELPLTEGVRLLRQQEPKNLAALSIGLNSLAFVKLARGELDEAEKLARECIALYGGHDLPTDLARTESCNLLGTIAVAQGAYAVAVDQFREGSELAAKLGDEGKPQQSRMLLNMAQVYRSQGDLAEATKVCREAWGAYGKFTPATSFGNIGFTCALANLEAAQGNFAASRTLATKALEQLQAQKIDSGALWQSATHCGALDALASRRLEEATLAWQKILENQTGTSRARTLNYLALCAEVGKRDDEALDLYAEARELEREETRSAPVTQFLTLWRSATLLDRKGRREEAIARLEEAADVVEAARIRAYGAADERAKYFAQFQPAFDQLVTWYVEAGDVEKAFLAAERGRSRSFLDQFQLAGADPRKTLTGPNGVELCRREAELRNQLSAVRARAQMFAAQGSEKEAQGLLKELEETQQEFSDVWRSILAASPMYRNLATDATVRDSLASLRRRVLSTQTILVAYHLGRENSHLLVVGRDKADSMAVPLTMPRWVVASLAKEPMEGNPLQATGTRGLVLQPRNDLKSPLKAPSSEEGSVPLTRELARHVVDFWRGRVEGVGDGTTRGLQLRDKRGVAGTSSNAGGDAVTEILFPVAVRQWITDRKLEYLVVIPDGPLHKLPLESLVTRHATRPTYLLDELPPIVYAPSAAALASIVERPTSAVDSVATLLTVGNPTYPQEAVAVTSLEPLTVAVRAATDIHAQLPPLPYTANECHRIEKLFKPSDVVLLEGETASEQNVVQSIRGKKVVHLAAHGFSDDRFGNLFGALALTPPLNLAEPARDDGFLSLYEITELPLQDCQLAVLSACVTNVGPQRPLEAGITLASGFLMAGARRVVASHWSVDDRSTAELMATFLDAIHEEDGTSQVVNYAKALHAAREKIRNTPEWSSPRYWAPFVLLGPAEDSKPEITVPRKTK